MAAGDAVFYSGSIANNDYLTIQPAAGTEVIVQNIYYPAAVEIERGDGTNWIRFDADTTYGAKHDRVFRASNTQYLRVKNISGASVYIFADGVQTK